MRITVNPPKSEWADLLRRPQIDAPVIGERVAAILDRVRAGGDRAVLDLTAEIDSVALDSLEVAPEEIERAEAAVSPELKRAIATAAEHIERFHAAQRPRTVDLETAPGVRCLQRAVPIRRVGLYVPGGAAPLFSTVLMLAVPARVAGCEQIVLCTPPQKDGSVARGGQKSVPARAAEQHRRAVGRECRAERGEREIGERGKAHRLAPADSPPRAKRRHREDVAQREQQEGAVFALHHALVAAEGKKERVDREQGKGIEIGNASAQRHDGCPPSKTFSSV